MSARGTAVVVDGSALLLTPLQHSGTLGWAVGWIMWLKGCWQGYFELNSWPILLTAPIDPACLPVCSGSAATLFRHSRTAGPYHLPVRLRLWGL